jgi:uncharacterized protein YecT (DUF1311 family)
MKRLLMIVVGFAWAVPVQAASFDCAKAGTKVEKLICADAELSKLDEEMAGLYREVLKASLKDPVLKQAQREWLNYRETCLAPEYKQKEISCLSYRYRRHNSILRGSLPTKQVADKSDSQLCVHIAAMVETGEATKLEPEDWESNTPRGKRYSIDIDLDGKADKVEIGCGSSECSVEIELSSGKPYDLSSLNDGKGFYLIRYKSSIYALVGYSEDDENNEMEIRYKYHLGKLYLIAPTGAKLVCGN